MQIDKIQRNKNQEIEWAILKIERPTFQGNIENEIVN